MKSCTHADHAAISADVDRFRAECSRHRRWTDAELVIAEHHCGSTLSVSIVRFEGEDHADA